MSTAFLALALLTIGQDPKGSLPLTQAHDQAKAFALGFQKDDHARLADLTYPKLTERIGSRARVAQFWKKKTTALRNQGLKLESYTAQAPKEIVKAGNNWLCIVPTRLTFKAIDGPATAKAYLLVLSHDQGKSWRILDGNDADTPKHVKTWLPMLPKSVVMPDVVKASVDKADPERTVFLASATNFKVCYPNRWEEGQRQGTMQLNLERGDNLIHIYAEERAVSLEDVIQLYERSFSGKPRKFFGQKEMSIAGARAKYFRFDESSDQELQQFHVCAFTHQGMIYRIIGLRRGGDAQAFEDDFFSVLQRFAFLKDRPEWVKQFEGATTKVALLGGLASFEVQKPRWTEDTFDQFAENQALEFVTYHYLPGNAWLRVTLHEAHGDQTAELQELLKDYLPRLTDSKHKAVAFPTPAGKLAGWEITGTNRGEQRTFLLSAVTNDGLAAWIMMESTTSQLDETRFEYEQVLEGFQLQARSKPAQPTAYPIRRNDNQRGPDPRVAAFVKKAVRLYAGPKSYDVNQFTADGKQALIGTGDQFFLEDLATRKREPLSIKVGRPFNLVLSADRKWLAYQVNDEITVAPFGFGFSKKARAHATMLAFGPGNKELLILTSSQKPTYDFRDEVRDTPYQGQQYVTSRLERLPLDGSPKKPLFDWPLIRVANFALSPNGKELAVVTNRDYPRTQQFGGYLYVCKPDGSDLRLLNKDAAEYRNLVWSADGKSLYALRRILRGPVGDGNLFDVERIAADSGAAVNLTRCGKINHLWAGGGDLFLELRDGLLPATQQGIFRIAPDELERATSVLPAAKALAKGDLAERVAKRLQPALDGTPLRDFVPTPKGMERFAQEFTAAIKDETGLVLDASPASLDRLTSLIDQLGLASGKHPINVLGVGAYYGETLRQVAGATWHLKPVPFGEWAPTRVPPYNNVAEVILPFSDTFGWAMLVGRVVHGNDLRARASGVDWLLVYPPTHVDDVVKTRFADYLQAKKLLDQGDIDAGLPMLEREWKKRPKNAQLARELIALCKALERGEQARALTRHAVEAGVEASDLLILHADDLMRSDAARAIVYYRKAAHLPFAPPETFVKLGRAYEQAGQQALAESCWRHAYFPASDFHRIEIRRMMGMPDFRPYTPGGSPFKKDAKDYRD